MPYTFRIAARTVTSLAAALACLGGLASASLAQEFPDPATDLKMRLAAFAAPFIAAENPGATIDEFAATIVCIVEALNPLPDAVKAEMLLLPDFEDALDMAVIYGEAPGRNLPIEANLEACF